MIVSVLALLIAEALLALDWRQTLTIAWNPLQWHEIKVEKIIGTNPSTRSVCAYFIFWMVVVGAVCLAFPKLGMVLSVTVILMELDATLVNRQHFGAWW